MQIIEHDVRPWGEYFVLLSEDNLKVKKICVSAGKRLSLQYHEKRDEHWYVVSGKARVHKNKGIYTISPGGSIGIKRGEKHRVEATGKDDLVFIEIQTGDYFGEDDIIRIEDDYGRGDFDHLKDWVDIKEEQIANKTDWWKKMK